MATSNKSEEEQIIQRLGLLDYDAAVDCLNAGLAVTAVKPYVTGHILTWKLISGKLHVFNTYLQDWERSGYEDVNTMRTDYANTQFAVSDL